MYNNAKSCPIEQGFTMRLLCVFENWLSHGLRDHGEQVANAGSSQGLFTRYFLAKAANVQHQWHCNNGTTDAYAMAVVRILAICNFSWTKV